MRWRRASARSTCAGGSTPPLLRPPPLQKAKKTSLPSFLLSRIPRPSTTSPAPPPAPGRALEEVEPELLLVVEAPGGGAGGGGLRRVLGRAAQAVGPWRARGTANLELDLAARAALEGVGAAGHVPASGDAGAVLAQEVPPPCLGW
ncbi:hypothetical protein VPH35_013393 [Triticum aestivum]